MRFGRRRGAAAGGYWQDKDETLAYLDAFVASRRGVEVYVEPATVVTETTVALVAADGEWTRRRIGTPKGGTGAAVRTASPAEPHRVPLVSVMVTVSNALRGPCTRGAPPVEECH